jgi:hypothetical protein
MGWPATGDSDHQTEPASGAEVMTSAGGWPTHGFSQGSGIRDVWNFWIVYPLGAWVFITAAAGWNGYLRKPISEGEIKREIERHGDTPS